MIDKDVAIAALSALCNANLTSTQQPKSQHGDFIGGCSGGPRQQRLLVTDLVSLILDADETCVKPAPGVDLAGAGASTKRSLIIDEDEFFDPQFDWDFPKLKDAKTYERGGEKYEPPYGWQRFGIKVLDKYSDDNTWLGKPGHRTESDPGEWPVSYHGTSRAGAAAIVKGSYQAGHGQVYGRGIYSSPDISEANAYAKSFVLKEKKYVVILQNRINREYRQICEYDKYWLIDILSGTSKEDEEKIVHKAIRPYGLLLKEV